MKSRTPILTALYVVAGLVACLLLSTAQARASPIQSQAKKDVLQIEPGVPIERKLSGGADDTYEINLETDRFIHLLLDQRGIDVVLSLVDPQGKEVVAVNSPNDTRGPERLWYVTETPGLYRIVVRSSQQDVGAGSYQIEISELHLASVQDRNRADGQRHLLKGAELLSQEKDESLKMAAAEFQSALDLWRASGDRAGEADALQNVGQFYANLNDPDKPLDYYNRALALVRELRDKKREAYLLYLVGEEYITSTLERKQKSLVYYHQSLALMREAGDRWGEARVLNKIGLVYGYSSDTQKALEYFLPLLPLQRSLDDQSGQAVTLNYIGGIYSNLGEHQQAHEFYKQALPLSRAVKDLEIINFTLRNMGVAYFNLGEYDRALKLFEENLANDHDPDSRGLLLTNIGSVHAKLGDYRTALSYYNQALPIWQQLKSKRGESSTLIQIGSAYRDLADYVKAVKFYNQALPLKEYVGDRRGVASVLINLGRVQLSLGDSQKSLDYFQQALEIGRATADQSIEAQALDGIARAQRILGNLEAARTNSEAALGIVEGLRAKIVTSELRTSYYASVQQYYDTYINLLIDLHHLHPADGYEALALEVSERARARSLVELLNESRVEIRQGVDPALLARERSLQQQLRAKAELNINLLSGKQSEERLTALKKDTDDLLALYAETEAQIRVNSPRYASLTQPAPITLKEMQQELDADTLLLEYRLGDDRSYLWAVTPNSLKSFSLPGRKQIEDAARHVYELLTARNLRPKFETPAERSLRITKADAEYPRAAALFAEMVLTPASQLLGTKRLVIVSDGALQYVPFAALPLPLTRPSRSVAFVPLLLKHEIVDLPSASTLAALRRESSKREEPPKQLAIIADPVFDKNDERVKNTKVRTKQVPEIERETRGDELLRSARETGFDYDIAGIPRLLFTRREATEIAELVPVGQRKVSLDFAANRDTAQSPELAQYRYVHFATHGLLNTFHPELSGLILSLVDEQGNEQDGFLRAFEVYNLRLNADMVVLSGCRTGLGKEIRGEGLLGLTRGFMYAGAQRLLVSLWAASDEASAELMVQTYRGMLGRARLRTARALRAAQLKMMRDRRWHAPYYWAAFVLRGEPN